MELTEEGSEYRHQMNEEEKNFIDSSPKLKIVFQQMYINTWNRFFDKLEVLLRSVSYISYDKYIISFLLFVVIWIF